MSIAGLLLALNTKLHAQFYSIDWSTVAGGGGTIGQPDAGRMSGANYSVEGGFWGIIAAGQKEGAPLLSIFRTLTKTVAVSWPSPSTGWELQQNTISANSLN